MTHHSNRIFRRWFLIEYLKESVRNRNSRQWRVHSYEKYDFKYLLYFTWPLIWLFTPLFEISKQAHYGPKRPPKIAEVRSISLQKHKGLSINYVIADRGEGSPQKITVLHRGGSGQMITVLHRVVLSKWLQFTVGGGSDKFLNIAWWTIFRLLVIWAKITW